MRNKLALLLSLTALVWCACNDSGLVKGNSASPTPSFTNPTPIPSATVAYFGPQNCYGNAGWQFVYPNDLDDPVDKGDAFICVWPCDIDPTIGVLTASEIIEVIDCDGACYLTSYPAPAGYPFAQTPAVTACNSWVPFQP